MPACTLCSLARARSLAAACTIRSATVQDPPSLRGVQVVMASHIRAFRLVFLLQEPFRHSEQ